MKNLIFVLVFVFSLGSCSNDQEKLSEDSLNFEKLDFTEGFDIDLSQAKFPATSEGLTLLLQGLTTEIYGVGELSQSLKFFQIEGYYVVKRLVSTENTSAKPCKTETITCTNADEVKAALTKIIGDGTRNVKISYVRNLLSVSISYSY
jgi:hypothetical protein